MKNTLGLLSSIIIISFPLFFQEAFLRNLHTVILYQVFAVLGLILFTYFLSKITKKKAIVLYLTLICVELGLIGFFYLLQKGVNFPEKIEIQARLFYLEKFRNIPMFDSRLGKYDDELFYTLKPGNQIFENWEFSNVFSINSIGIRDDEMSITNPEVICLGDSFTMGWGVDQKESFPDVLEKELKAKTLNMGIASYGTAREYINLQKINYSQTKIIILQFCMNDIIENRLFLKKDSSLQISSHDIYEKTVMQNQLSISYYPFKYTIEALGKILKKIKRIIFNEKFDNDSFEALKKEFVSDFFTFVKLIQKNFSGKIIIFNLEAGYTNDEVFLKFKRHLDANPNPKIYLLDTSILFDKNDYFEIDDHLNSKGHGKLSEAILKLINRNKMLD